MPLTVNKGEMKQVVLNLVKNSFEAMPAGGDIRIETIADRRMPRASRW